ncbi:MAG: hypothetical protein ACD_2C00131G0017 [uncultured bacterium (gcode 4)]|uniref:ABC transporter domain-containing protein n=1 Tax=uncultured bacterium (gcode 4) TaxID=1234023 RepID=K2G5Y8_9BACT|nr:MAG: hypothetical protein ACD_2C00131G0017 [uncultured bacterium (gcode 4)]
MNVKKFFYWAKILVRNLLRLDRFFWKDLKKYIISIYVIMVLDVWFNFISRWSQAIIINNLIQIANWVTLERRTIIILAVVLVATLILPSFINIVSWFYRLVIWRKIDELINLTFIRKKASFDLNQLENTANTTLFQRVQENMWRFRSYFYTQFDISGSIFNLVAILFTLILIKPVVALVILVFTLPEAISKLSISKHVWTIDNLHWPIKKKYNYLKGLFFQWNPIMDIKFSGNIDFFTNKIRKIIDPFLIEQYKNDKKRSINSAMTIFISKVGIIISAFILIYAVYNKEMQIGTFVFLYGLIASFQSSLSFFFWYIVQQYEDNLYVEEYFQILDMKNEMRFSQNPIVLPAKITPKIELRNVSFSYPDKDKEILHKLNLTINPWEKIAIVWVNWAGKSTLVKLLTRFYDTTGWEVLIDWNNIKDLDLQSWWSQVSYMQQDTPSYMFEVKQSIAMSDTTRNIDMKKVENAAQMSLAHDFIKEFKNWYAQQLWRNFDDGESLSWWQWQRMNLARIFYKDPQVYILDEPTSAMDAEAESKIFETLANLPKDKTVIFISHRFSTIRQADRICVIEDWNIIEVGSHKELIANNKSYKRLFELQAKGYA